jgi:hypothetical protein
MVIDSNPKVSANPVVLTLVGGKDAERRPRRGNNLGYNSLCISVHHHAPWCVSNPSIYREVYELKGVLFALEIRCSILLSYTPTAPYKCIISAASAQVKSDEAYGKFFNLLAKAKATTGSRTLPNG